MPSLFRRPSSIVCFFCHNPSPLVQDPRNFRCPSCGCWNRYDEHGAILSDEPAMHDESLNLKSFARRASPSKDRLPSLYGKAPFCHTCQTNQMLLINLLSNYLPPPEDPEYSRRLEKLPDYKASLQLRYPPVCDDCLPAVEDEIQRKNQMARTKALGGWLKESKGKEQQRRVSTSNVDGEKTTPDLWTWTLRGVLWTASFLTAFTIFIKGAFGAPFSVPSYAVPLLPFVTLLSISWITWDPTYPLVQKAQKQSRDVRVKGKHAYISLQVLVWVSRSLASAFFVSAVYRPQLHYLRLMKPGYIGFRIYSALAGILEFSAFAASFLILHVQKPPSVRLLQTNNLRLSRSSTPSTATRSGTPALSNSVPADPDLFASLSLSSEPIVTTANKPIFGVPSLPSAVPPSLGTNGSANPDAMDWTPTDPAQLDRPHSSLSSSSDAWLRPQRFFAPEAPTGLEQLFERTHLVEDAQTASSHAKRKAIQANLFRLWKRWWIAFLLLPSVAILFSMWGNNVPFVSRFFHPRIEQE